MQLKGYYAKMIPGSLQVLTTVPIARVLHSQKIKQMETKTTLRLMWYGI
jgi:hypothetical protein